MIGAIAGDIIGSVYEYRQIKTKEFPLFQPGCEFTDDTVLTIAVADAILSGRMYAESIRQIGRRYPDAGYGGSFIQWLHADDSGPYKSWGNGSAMRVSPVGFAFSSEAEVLRQARMSAEITHNHPGGDQGRRSDRSDGLFGPDRTRQRKHKDADQDAVRLQPGPDRQRYPSFLFF